MLRPIAAFTFGSLLAAQTFVVDAANGPGAHFTDIAAAVAVVPDGAVLVVRPGTYGAFAIVNRGVTILGEPGARMADACSVSGTAAGQSVTLRGLDWPSAAVASNTDLVRVANCSGLVLLDTLTMPPLFACATSPFCLRHAGVLIQGSSRVVLRDSDIRCTVNCQASAVVIETCRIAGENGGVLNNGNGPWFTSRPALALTNAAVQIAGASQILGGSGAWGGLLARVGANAPGIWGSASHVRVLDGIVAAGQTVGFTNPPAAAIYANSSLGTVRLSPRATMQPTPFGSQPAVEGIAPTIAPMPQLTTVGAVLGTSLLATVATEPGELVILVVGFAGQPTLVPRFADPFWLDATLHWFHAVAAQSSASGVTGSIAVPSQPHLLGLQVMWQAAVFGSATGAQASNPAVGLVR
jgi:hypothetical protein